MQRLYIGRRRIKKYILRVQRRDAMHCVSTLGAKSRKKAFNLLFVFIRLY